MKRFLACLMSVVLAVGLMPAPVFAQEGSMLKVAPSPAPAPAPVPAQLASQAAPAPAAPAPAAGAPALATQATTASVPAARPEVVTGATAPANEATREKVYVEDYRDRDYSHYYGPADDIHVDDACIIETAAADAAGKTLVFEQGRTYTFGSYVHSHNRYGTIRLWREQGVRFKTSDVVIDGNGAIIEWDPTQTFTGWEGFVLEGTAEQPIHDIVIRNLTFKCLNNSWLYEDPTGSKPYREYAFNQLLGLYCENVLVENCTFIAEPNPDPALYKKSVEEGRGVNNIWFSRGPKNVTVRDCTIRNVTKGSQESGGNILFNGYPEYYDQIFTAEQRAEYDKLDAEGQYQMLQRLKVKGTVKNILVEDNEIEHACHDESMAFWAADEIKDVLIRDNTFNIHDHDAHVPSNLNFTFAYAMYHDTLENVNFTHNNVYAEAAWSLMNSRANMGGDLHVTDNDIRFNRVKLDRQRVPASDGVHYVYSEKADIATMNGIMYAQFSRDYVDFSNNRVTYDNTDGGEGLYCLMGAKNVLCAGNTFTLNGPLTHFAYFYAYDAAPNAGHETAFTNNTFEVNGPLKGALLRGGFPFTGNIVRLNGDVSSDTLFRLCGHFDNSTTPRTNVPYVLPSDVEFTGNKVFAKVALPTGLKALDIYDVSFAGHAVDFTANKFWSTVDQPNGSRSLVCVQDVQGSSLEVDATDTESNIFNRVAFYRTGEGDSGYADYGAVLADPTVRFRGQQYTATSEHWTRHDFAVDTYDGEDPDENAKPDCALEGHSWGDATYTWSADNATCTARRVCANDPAHVDEETAETTSEVTRVANCVQKSETTYTATFVNNAFETQVKAVEGESVDPSAHAWDTGTVTVAPTCTAAGERTFTCTRDTTHTRTEAEPALGHAWDAGTVTTEATCEAAGVRTFTCTHDATHKRTEAVPATGHAWDAGAVTTAPTCETAGVRTFTCAHDTTHTRTEAIPALGHMWGAGVVTVAPGCATTGVQTYTCIHDETHLRTESIPAIGHLWDAGVVTTAPTATTPGVRTFTCSTCRATYTEAIPATDTDPGSGSGSEAGTDPGSGTGTEPGTTPEPGQKTPSKEQEGKTSKADKAKNPITVKVKSPSIKATKLKQASRTIPAKKAFTVRKAKGAVTYVKLSGNAKIALSQTGKITLRKGMGKGTYKLKAMVYAKGNAHYKPGGKIVTLKLRVA